MIDTSFIKRFRWLGLVLITTLLVLIFRLPAVAQTPRHYTELEFPPLPDISLPQYERYQLNNGMVVYLMEDHQLPLVKGNALIKTGSRLEPIEEVGLAETTGSLMRLGGTQQHSANEVNELLEQRAARVEVNIGTNSGNAGFNTLTEDLETVFNLFSEIVREPAFAPQPLTLIKTQQQGQIARRNDDPGDIASRELRKLIYGEESPYARTTEYETIDNISRDDVIAFHQKYVRPENIILGIVGDFDPNTLKPLIEETLGTWQPKTPDPEINIPSAEQKQSQGVFFVSQPQLNQSNVLLGHLGGKFDSPDYPALAVVNGLFNGFGGRLYNNLRSRQGLAYSVYGYWSAAYDHPGIFIAGGQTASQTTVQFITSLIEEIQRVQENPIESDELDYAKESIINSFVFKFENPSQTLSRLMTYEYFGYPQDFIFDYQEGVKATTVEDVQRVAQQYLKPENLVTLVVGNEAEINPPLSQLGQTVTPIDITIPGEAKR
ncbi:processing protease [Crocosphaera subtropica ATCC 51142]|uniref:Processing protease n=1 Tax=Crocosphaera subtropica (strain ATCC 51142 / BH68) TaxID=43989 RepID=B1WPS1_CROS5|nr:pitrilysin family protein [Crocosphaera subtropica]ACB51641.1 processing protease [Crocosphaera subtropica ATCC 51142]